MTKNKRKYFAASLFFALFVLGVICFVVLLQYNITLKWVFEYILIPILTMCASAGVIIIKYTKSKFSKTYFYGILSALLIMTVLIYIKEYVVIKSVNLLSIVSQFKKNTELLAVYAIILITIFIVQYYLLNYLSGKGKSGRRRKH